MKNFTELREELDEILVEEELITEEEIDQLANDLFELDLDEETLDGVMNELISEIEVQKGERVDTQTKRARSMDYRQNRAKKIMQMRKYRKSARFKALERKRAQMAKRGKTATGRDIKVKYGSDMAQRIRDKKAELQKNDFDPELNELNVAQRIKRSLASKIASKKAQIKREKTANKPPTPERIKAALDRFLRQKALAVADKSGAYADASAGQKEKIEAKASKILTKVRSKWEKKFKKDVTKKMKDAYRERVTVKNPEAEE